MEFCVQIGLMMGISPQKGLWFGRYRPTRLPCHSEKGLWILKPAKNPIIRMYEESDFWTSIWNFKNDLFGLQAPHMMIISRFWISFFSNLERGCTKIQIQGQNCMKGQNLKYSSLHHTACSPTRTNPCLGENDRHKRNERINGRIQLKVRLYTLLE